MHTANERKIELLKDRLDRVLVSRGLVSTRSQAESYVRMGNVSVDGRTVTKPGASVSVDAKIKVNVSFQYVSRAALKLESVAKALHLNFTGKTILDVGSSTGGFTQYALEHGAKKVIAVDVGTNQLHPILRDDQRIELHEQLDIRSLTTDDQKAKSDPSVQYLSSSIDIVLIDVSFISLREILPHIATLVQAPSLVVAMVKPQFEVGDSGAKHKGVIKNEKVRRQILKDLELFIRNYYKIADKADSAVSGEKGNTERFYLLKKLST